VPPPPPDPSGPSHYALLGVDPLATEAEITRASLSRSLVFVVPADRRESLRREISKREPRRPS